MEDVRVSIEYGVRVTPQTSHNDIDWKMFVYPLSMGLTRTPHPSHNDIEWKMFVYWV